MLTLHSLKIIKNSTERILIPVEYNAGTKSPKKIELETIVDTGSYASYLGYDMLSRLGIEVTNNTIFNAIKYRKLFPFVGITDSETTYPKKWSEASEKIYASLSIRLNSIILGAVKIKSPSICIPLSFYIASKENYNNINFEQHNLVLIGMDILREFNIGVDIENENSHVFRFSQPLRTISSRVEKRTRISFKD